MQQQHFLEPCEQTPSATLSPCPAPTVMEGTPGLQFSGLFQIRSPSAPSRVAPVSMEPGMNPAKSERGLKGIAIFPAPPLGLHHSLRLRTLPGGSHRTCQLAR